MQRVRAPRRAGAKLRVEVAMSEGSTAEYAVTYGVPDAEMDRKRGNTAMRRKAIPWTRIVVDTLLVASILLASASFLTVR